MSCNLLFFKLSISSAFEKWKAFLYFVYSDTGFKFISFLPFHLIESSQHLPKFLPRLWYKYFIIPKEHLKSWNHEPFNPLNNRKLFWILLPLWESWNFWYCKRKCLKLPAESWCPEASHVLGVLPHKGWFAKLACVSELFHDSK